MAAVHTAIEVVPETYTTSDANLNIGDDITVNSMSKTEQSNEVLLDARKRDLLEPSTHEEPGVKRVKRSSAHVSDDSNGLITKETSSSNMSTDNFSKEAWQGFCEIESEPAYFSAILRDMGVQGINVREVLALEPWFLETLPELTYGLILLYRYREHVSSGQPEGSPTHMWFANQLPAQNSCATLAMINIVMVNTDIEIGDHLQQFKDFTKDFTPYQRGEALASFDFVRKIHNSFAKKMDILEADKHLSYRVKKAQRFLGNKKGRRKSTNSASTNGNAESYEDNAHHFIAYVPIGNEIWKLDGMEAQPIRIATFDAERGESWLSTVADSIRTIMADEGHEYTSFAITQSPLLRLRKEACLAVNTIKHTEACLNDVSGDWKSSTIDKSSPPQPQMLGIEDQLSAHPVPDTLAAIIAGEQMTDLLERRGRLLKELDQLAANIISEMQDEAEEVQKAARRRYDCGPVIKMWAEMLASNGYLEENLDRFMDKKAKK